MRSLLLILGVFMVMVFATWAYRVNNDTRDAMGRVASLQREIRTERETIAVLEAEWAYLNRPDRLLALSEGHFTELRLMPLHPDHFSDPMKVAYPTPEDPLLAELIEAAILEVRGGS
ncbi:MAG: cell division protein FtsL [Rhodobacteraceae bacterium]|nr:cell division protein FtsL [Paracoccaceae bacterium]